MSDSTPYATLLSQTIAKMIKPLAALLMQQGITYVGLQSLLKESFVEAAEQDPTFQLNKKRQTDSRISLLTGVHRKEVKRIREQIATPQSGKALKASHGAQMMARWLGHPDYTDDAGLPKPLFRQHDSEPSFANLVLSVSKDKHPRSILDDWLKQKLIRIDDEGKIHLQQAGYMPQDDQEEKLFFAGKNISEHLHTVSHNLSDTPSPLFDRAVYYHNLSNDSVTQLQQLAEEEMLKVLTKFNQKAAQLQQQDSTAPHTPDNTHSIHLGAYFSHRRSEGIINSNDVLPKK